MSRSRNRILSDAEIEIWLQVAQTVLPRAGAVLPQRRARPEASIMAPPVPTSSPGPRSKPPTPPILPGYTPPAQARKAPGLPLAPFEKRYRQKVSQGRVDIEGAIDLHGMTQAQAHAALHGFLRFAQGNGARLVLVVTGKGRSSSRSAGLGTFHDEPGVLRRAVPHWLRDADLRGVVLGFEEASLSHGGIGALYVRLRRRES